MGRLTGSLIRGLSGEHTEYTVDPNTGQTVPTTVKDKPGSVFKSILAYGLMGGQGIGPKEGEQNFAQGLLAGLGGGTREATEQKEKLDQERRAQAQQQYANQLKANEEQRQNKELSMKEQLNNAAIANYTATTSMEKFNLMHAYQENQHGAVQAMQAKDEPILHLSESAGIKPIHENLSPTDYQKLLADNNSPEGQQVRAHTVIPIVTGQNATTNPDGSLSWTPVISLYPVAAKYTADTLSQLKDAGYKETDPLYKDVALKVKNGSPVEPRELLNVYKEIGQHFDYAKNRIEETKANAEMVRANAEASEAGVRSQILKLDLKDRQKAENGSRLFNYIGDDNGFTRGKEKVTIPVTKEGGYDFGQLNDEEKVSLRSYLDAKQNASSIELDKLVQASKADPENPTIKKQIQDAGGVLSVLNNMDNSLNGTRKQAQIRLGSIDQVQQKLSDIAQSHAQKLTGDSSDMFTGLIGKGYSEAQAQKALLAAPLPPAEKLAISQELTSYYGEITPLLQSRQQESAQANSQISNAAQDAWLRSHPTLEKLVQPPSTNILPAP